jgi:aminopeptidase YwaD
LIDHIQEHVHQLATVIGPRPQGSRACHEAAAYLRRALVQAGLEVEEQGYACLDWACSVCRLEVNGVPIPVGANMFSPPYDGIAPLVRVGSREELVAADLTGGIAVLHDKLATAPLSPKGWFLISEEECELIRTLESKQPAALIFIQSKPGFLDRMTEDAELRIPAVTVPGEAAASLLDPAKASAHLVIKGHTQPGTAANLVGRRGAGPFKIVLCAHYDTKIDTPGATDNAAGVAAMLALAERLKREPLPCMLEAVAFSGEESLPIGDDTYCLRGEADFPKIIAAINFDGVGADTGLATIASFSESEALRQTADAIVNRHAGIRWTEPWPQSNHSTFAWRGVPSLAFSSEEVFARSHVQADTEETVRLDTLEEVLNAAEAIVRALAEKTPAWARKAETE